MRSAEEMSAQVFNSYAFSQNEREAMIKLINEARKEAIRECAEKAKSEWIRWGEHMGHAVEKKSILKLLEQIK